jgi:hypothetical protein
VVIRVVVPLALAPLAVRVHPVALALQAAVQVHPVVLALQTAVQVRPVVLALQAAARVHLAVLVLQAVLAHHRAALSIYWRGKVFMLNSVWLVMATKDRAAVHSLRLTIPSRSTYTARYRVKSWPWWIISTATWGLHLMRRTVPLRMVAPSLLPVTYVTISRRG